MVPIPVTGWNRDLIIESTAVGPFTNYASEMNAGVALLVNRNALTVRDCSKRSCPKPMF
jgi:hypothetical protein